MLIAEYSYGEEDVQVKQQEARQEGKKSFYRQMFSGRLKMMNQKKCNTKEDSEYLFKDLELLKEKILQMIRIDEAKERIIIEEIFSSIKADWKNREKELQKRKECCYYENALKGNGLCQNENLRKLIAESKKIYFVFASSAYTDFARAIMTYTNSDYYHVAISLNEGLTNLYSFSPQIGQDQLSGGFTCENIHTYKKNDYDIHVSCMLVTSERYKQLLQEISAMMKHQRQTEYNYAGLINYVLGKREETNGYRMFCSQFIVYLFRKLGIDAINKEPCFTSPEDIAGLGEESGMYHLYDGKAAFYDKEKVRKMFDAV